MVIRTRDQLLDHIGQKGSRSVRRALDEGTIEFLGGFNTSPPCWITRVTSSFKHAWNIGVDSTGKIHIVERVPWHLWIGGNPMCRGDNPGNYYRLKDTARRIREQKTS